MAIKTRLSEQQREYYSLVSEAAFANPFGEGRDRLDTLIAGIGERLSPRENLEAALLRLRANMKNWNHVGSVADYSGEELELLRTARLFDLFHAKSDLFDEHIRKQIETGLEPLKFAGASKVLRELAKLKLTEEEAIRCFEVFFQFRRAYYFIAETIKGESPCMIELRSRMWQNIFTHKTKLYEELLWNRLEDFSTLLLGETGTGKGAVARALGSSGYIPFDLKRSKFEESFTKSFVPINLAQFQENLIESELFGHKKGAFTGAVINHDGVLSKCSSYGATFLDEIGDISVPIQVKLLIVLQDRTFSPVGGHERVRFNGRIIAATNKPIDKLRREGRFRDDFYYRLCSDVIELPTLRQRLEEEPKELDVLLSHISERMFSNKAGEHLVSIKRALNESVPKQYPWPGNVRELEQAVRQVTTTRRYTPQNVCALPMTEDDSFLRSVESGGLDATGLLAGYCKILYERLGTYEDVARLMKIDRRTAKKYVTLRLQA